MRMMVISLLCTAASVSVLAMAGGQPAPAELKVGDDAPAWSLPGSDGKTHSLAEYKGKQAVVLAWYPKAFTGG
jgi:peroxiredoxin Q/BCP